MGLSADFFRVVGVVRQKPEDERPTGDVGSRNETLLF